MSNAKGTPIAPDVERDTADGHRTTAAVDRRLLHIQTLYEATRELSGAATPAAVLNAFLPIAMGPLGLTFGFGVLRRGGALHVATLGLGAADREPFDANARMLVEKFFPSGATGPAITSPAVLAGPHLSHSADVPAGTGAIAVVPLDAGSHAVLGFGPKLTGEPFSDDETDLLNGLVTTLSTALRKACAEQDITERNTSLKAALAQTREAHEALDRRAFQLHTLYEATLELSAINEPAALCNAFVLTLMGTFSFAAGWVALYGPEGSEPDAVYRGPQPDRRPLLGSHSGRDKVLGRFVELKDRMPQRGQSTLLEDDAARAALPVDADVAVLFTLDNDWRGAIGLFSPLSEAAMPPDMRKLLLSLVRTFMVSLGNAKHVQLIHALNSDLAARNVELQNTLDELTSARREIGLLTEAREAIIGLVQGEVQRVWRASWLDVSLIILAGVILGGLFNASSPSGIDLIPRSFFEPPPETVAARDARTLAGSGAVIIDARPVEFYNQGHLRDAVNLPSDMFGFAYSMKLADLDPAVPVIVYGRTISRNYDEDVAQKLTGLGHEKVLVLDGGLDAWTEAGYEVAP
jgi:rhodanese-related sulfurtransferase